MTEDIVKLIQSNKKHEFYDKSVEYALDIAIHADEESPGELLKERRPKESETILKYREKIYVHKTEYPVFKVSSSLMKIRKSQDWMIKFPQEENSIIATNETLENYTEYNFPKHTSFTNWFFAVCFKQYIIDANAVSLVVPLGVFDKDYKADDSTYLQPYPTIFNSKQILDYSNDYYLLESEEKHTYTVGKAAVEGKIFYYVDKDFVYELKETTSEGKLSYLINPYAHNLGIMPVVRLYGVTKKEKKHVSLFKSRISPMIPSLKEALREYSDLQAEVVQHIHSTLVYYQGQDCTKCNGTGKVIGGKDKAPIECKSCKGKGKYPFNPYENFEVRQPKAGEPAAPNPAAYYLQKSIEIAKLQDQRVRDHIRDALSSINFEFLDKSPLNQSGYAKDVDKSELNNFVHSVAEDMVRIFDDHYYLFNEYRYKIVIPNKENREKLLPTIPVPQKYDILSEQYVLEEIVKLKEKNVDTSILNASLVDYANKKFGNDEEIRDYICSCIELDPFASENEDNLLSKLQNNGISKVNYVIHCNIKDFVKKAVEEDEDFYDKKYSEKFAVVKGYAEEMIKENSASAKVISMVQQQPDSNSQTATG